MNRISAFISYSSKQKKIGGKFKSCLENYCGYKTFIAHDDISGSTIWEDEIIKAIKNADFFIPLISEEFKNSPFTDQETGVAVSLQKKIIPIKLHKINPYGFIEKYHALQYKQNPQGYYYQDNIRTLALSIAQIGIFSEPQSNYHLKSLDSIIYAFCNSRSFDTTNAIIQILCKCNDLSSQHIRLIVDGIKNNSQIYGAYGLSTLKQCLHIIYNIPID